MNESGDRLVRNARYSLGLLLSINLFNYIDRYILAACEPRIKHELLGNDPNALTKMGSLATAFTVSYMLCAPVFGWLADRMSRWLLVGVGVILWSVASGASGLAGTFGLLLITRLFIGIGEAGYGPAAPTIISDLYPVERRGAVLSWFYMAIPLGSALGYAWGELFAKYLGWRWAFYAVVPPGLVLGALALMRKDTRSAQAAHHTAKLADYLRLFRNRSYIFDCAGMCAMTFAIGGIAFWMPHYLEIRHAGEHASTIFGLISAVGGIIATLAGGRAGDWLRTRTPGAYFIVSGFGILLGCPFVLLMLVLPFPYAWGAIFVAVFFLFFNTGPSNTILANVTHPSVRATAFALNIFLIHALGDALSPPVLGRIAEHYTWNAAFGVVIAVMAIAAGLWLLGVRFLEGDTRRITHPAATEPRGFDVKIAGTDSHA